AERRVREGQIVARGDVLFVVSSERTSRTLGATQQSVAGRLELRRSSLVGQIAATRDQAIQARAAARESDAALAVDADKLGEASAAQVERVGFAAEVAERYERMRAESFVSEEQRLAKRSELLEQRSRRLALERERDEVARRRREQRDDADLASGRYAGEIAE